MRCDHRLFRCHHAAEGFASEGAEDHYPPDLRLEPIHLTIDLRVDLEARELHGSVTHRVRAHDPGARSLRLDAVDLAIDAVEDEEGEPIAHAYDGRALRVAWETPLEVGEERSLRIAYRASEPSSGLFFQGPDTSDPERVLFAATDHETERARHWLPCVDHPSVRTPLSIRIRAAEELTVLANGEEVEEHAHGDGTRSVRFELEEPCPSYLICFVVGKLLRWDDGEHRGVPVAAFTTAPFERDDLERTFDRTREMLAWLEEKLGLPYPYPKYFQFAVEGLGGAMENISLVSWDDKYLLDEALDSEIGWQVRNVVLHEMAHAWFGDLVVCRDFAHAWLKESWATYMETCWLEHHRGDDWMRYDLFQNARQYFEESREKYRRPIVTRRYDSSFDLFDRHLYPGGAIRLHMLRHHLGEESFWAGVRLYLERFAHRVVETDDFRRALEETSGRSLERFFDQFFRSPGHPQLAIHFEHDPAAKEGVFTIEQKQEDDTDGVPLFCFDLELEWEIGSERARKAVPIARRVERFRFAMAEDPQIVRIDPDAKVVCELDFDPGEAKLLAQLERAKDVTGRIRAGYALAKRGRASGIRAIAAAFPDEPFWGVRAQWAEALGEARSGVALEALLDLAEKHADPPVLAPLFRALGSYRDPRVVDVLLRRIDAGLPPRAAAAAFEALGEQEGEESVLALRAAAQREGRGGFAQAGALRALGSTRDEEAARALLERSRPGASGPRARPAAAEGLGRIALYLGESERASVIDALVDLLRDVDPRVRRAAALALGAARARQSRSALEAHRATLPLQEQAEIDRVLRKLDEDPDSALRGLEKKVEKLEKRLVEMEGRLPPRDPPPEGA